MLKSLCYFIQLPFPHAKKKKVRITLHCTLMYWKQYAANNDEPQFQVINVATEILSLVKRQKKWWTHPQTDSKMTVNVPVVHTSFGRLMSCSLPSKKSRSILARGTRLSPLKPSFQNIILVLRDILLPTQSHAAFKHERPWVPTGEHRESYWNPPKPPELSLGLSNSFYRRKLTNQHTSVDL